MFDHMVEANNLWPTFVKYNLTQQDMIFIKELIAGQKTHGDDCQVCKTKKYCPLILKIKEEIPCFVRIQYL